LQEPDALVKALVKENQALGLRALATAQGLKEETITEILALTSDDIDERGKVIRGIPELVGDGERALLLLERLRRGTRGGNDLYFFWEALGEVERLHPDHARGPQGVEGLRARFFEHIPKLAEGLFRKVETGMDGQVALWRDIPAGAFWMGSPEDEGGSAERPRRRVTITRPFRMAVVPVTNEQYAAFDPGHPWSQWEAVPEEELGHHPVVSVSWYEAVSFCRWLSSCFEWARGCRLPTEAEWEYACRAGTETRYWSGEEKSDLARVGWYDENSGARTHRVGKKAANPWGLYDAHGNAREWCQDWYGNYSPDPEEDPTGPPRGDRRVDRGGSAWIGAGGARAAFRGIGLPGIRLEFRGFRPVIPAVP